MKFLVGHTNSGYGRTTRGKTVTALSGPRRGSKPPGKSISVRKGGR